MRNNIEIYVVRLQRVHQALGAQSTFPIKNYKALHYTLYKKISSKHLCVGSMQKYTKCTSGAGVPMHLSNESISHYYTLYKFGHLN